MSAQAERIQTGRLREDPVSKLLLQFSFPEKMFPHAAILKHIALLGTPQFFLQPDGAVTNIIPDPVFIFGFGWGMEGAASIGLKSRCKTMPTESDRRQFNLSAILSDGSDFCQGQTDIFPAQPGRRPVYSF